MLGGLHYVLPELPDLIGVVQSPPHIKDVWNHTLDTLRALEEIFNTLIQEYPEEWLIYLELIEVIKLTKNAQMDNSVYDFLWELKKDKKYKKLIEDGFEVINV